MQIVARAGRYAADWTFADLSALRRWYIRRLPTACARAPRSAWASASILATVRESKVKTRFKGTTAGIDINSALFDQLRDPATIPMRAFYASAIDRLLAHCARRCRSDRHQRSARRVEPCHHRPRPAASSKRQTPHERRRRLPACLIAGLPLPGPVGVAAAQVPAGAADHRSSIRESDAGTAPRRGCAKAPRSCSSETLAAAGEVVVDREERLQAFDRLQLPASAQR